MSPEVCPFCGKPFMRLKSHLPHCKAAKEGSRTPSARRDDPLSSRPTSLPSEKSREGKKASQTLPKAKKSKKESELLALSPPLSASKSKKKGAPSLIEAVRQGPSEQTTPTSSDRLLDPCSLAGDPISQDNLEKDSEINHPALLPTETKLKGASKAKRTPSKTKAQSLSTKVSDGSQDSGGQDVGDVTRPCETAFLEDLAEKHDDPSVKEGIWDLRGGHQGRVTLHSVKASLGRHDTSKPSVLEQLETMTSVPTTDPPGENQIRGPIRQSQTPNRRECGPNPSTTLVSQAKQLPGNASHTLELLVKSQQAFLLPPQNEDLPQSNPTPSPSPQTPFYHSTPPPLGSTDTNKEGDVLLATRSRSTDGTPPRVSLSSSPTCPCPSCPLNLSAKKESMGVYERWTADRPKLHFRKPDGALTDRSLGQVTLRELPEWLAIKTPGQLGEAVEMLQGGWQWYYRKYIDVRKGGVGGVGMLLAGYCVLGYMWNYPRIRRDCWRKYH